MALTNKRETCHEDEGSSLHVENVSAGVLSDVNIDVKCGECLAIVGASGAGKSTLLRCLADLIPHLGHIRLGATDQSGISAPNWRQRICYVPSESGWWEPKVRDHFPSTDTALTTIIRQFGLDEKLLNSAPERLSTGERQRFALIRALSLNPYVLLDEPTSALDHETTLHVEDYLKQWLGNGHILLIASHDSQQVQRLADNILTLKKSL